MKAIGLFSGGLDSALAIRLIQEQGVHVTALNFSSPFCTCNGKGCSKMELAKQLDVNIKIIPKGDDYIELIRNPTYGYGKGINPCIDCKIYILQKAKQYADEIGAAFIFTGDVLAQRPMSQHLNTLKLIEKEAGLENQVLRPLSAAHLPPTLAEQKGWVDRTKFLDLQGKSRKPQLSLAQQFKMQGFMCGGAGCKLTDKQYAKRLKAWLETTNKVSKNDILMTMKGRHFIKNNTKIIVGRNQQENNMLETLKQDHDIRMEAANNVGPVTLIRDVHADSIIELAAYITAYYSDAPTGKVNIKYFQFGTHYQLETNKTKDDQFKKYMTV